MTGWDEFTTPSGLRGHVTGQGERLALVLHGGPGMTDYTTGLSAEVRDGGEGALRVARYQQRGQPPSTTAGPLTIDQFVDDAWEVIDHLGADAAFVVGHSWGAHLALYVALGAPERTLGLLPIDGLGPEGDGGTGTMTPIMGSRLEPEAVEELAELGNLGLGPDEFATRQIRLVWPGYFADPSTAPPAPTDLRVSAHVNEGVFGDINARLASRVLVDALPGLDVPTVLMICEASPIDPRAQDRVAELLPNVEVVRLDCGHFPWIELPGSCAAATRRLLELSVSS